MRSELPSLTKHTRGVSVKIEYFGVQQLNYITSLGALCAPFYIFISKVGLLSGVYLLHTPGVGQPLLLFTVIIRDH